MIADANETAEEALKSPKDCRLLEGAKEMAMSIDDMVLVTSQCQHYGIMITSDHTHLFLAMLACCANFGCVKSSVWLQNEKKLSH